MFKLINFFNKNKENLDLKVMATENFLDNIKDSKKNVSSKEHEIEDKYFFFINKGIKELANFTQDNDSESLNKSLNHFIKAVGIRNSKPEAYFFLSYIANMMEEYPLAINYLHVVEAIDPNFVGLSDLKESLNENLSHAI